MLCLFVWSNSYSQPKSDKINSKFPLYHNIDELKEFKGFKDIQGSLLEPISTIGGYGVSVYAKGNYNIVALEWCISGEKVKYKLLDTLHIGHIKSNQAIIFTTCRLNKKTDDKIVALVKTEDKEYFKKVFKAWRVNIQTNRFETIAVKKVDCLNEGSDTD
jgi:hypothetical protein